MYTNIWLVLDESPVAIMIMFTKVTFGTVVSDHVHQSNQSTTD